MKMGPTCSDNNIFIYRYSQLPLRLVEVKKFEFIENLKSDVMFKAYGKSLEEMFTNAALALFSVICQTDKIEHKKVKLVEVKGNDLEDLMLNWLQKLIGIVDTDDLFFSKFEILTMEEDGMYLKARCHGEPVTPEKGETVVKGVTYYKYEFKKAKEGYSIRVSLDI